MSGTVAARPLAPRLVVVPSDPLAEYEAAGYEGLDRYYNPQGMFAEVIALSPRERGERRAHGLTIVGVPAERFGHALREIGPHVVRAYGGGWAARLVCRHRLAGHGSGCSVSIRGGFDRCPTAWTPSASVR